MNLFLCIIHEGRDKNLKKYELLRISVPTSGTSVNEQAQTSGGVQKRAFDKEQ